MIKLLIALALVLLLIPVAYAVPNQIMGVNALRANSASLLFGSSGSSLWANVSGSGYFNSTHSPIYTATGGPWGGWSGLGSGTLGTLGWSISPVDGGGRNLPGLGQGGDPVATIPEPATLLLFGAGLAGAGIARRVRQAREAA